MKPHNLFHRILALFLTLAMGFALPAPAHALRNLNTVENAGLEEELAARLQAGQPTSAAGLEEEEGLATRTLLKRLQAGEVVSLSNSDHVFLADKNRGNVPVLVTRETLDHIRNRHQADAVIPGSRIYAREDILELIRKVVNQSHGYGLKNVLFDRNIGTDEVMPRSDIDVLLGISFDEALRGGWVRSIPGQAADSKKEGFNPRAGRYEVVFADLLSELGALVQAQPTDRMNAVLGSVPSAPDAFPGAGEVLERWGVVLRETGIKDVTKGIGLITAFPGKPAPKFPEDPRIRDERERREALVFWNSHIFVSRSLEEPTAGLEEAPFSESTIASTLEVVVEAYGLFRSFPMFRVTLDSYLTGGMLLQEAVDSLSGEVDAMGIMQGKEVTLVRMPRETAIAALVAARMVAENGLARGEFLVLNMVLGSFLTTSGDPKFEGQVLLALIKSQKTRGIELSEERGRAIFERAKALAATVHPSTGLEELPGQRVEKETKLEVDGLLIHLASSGNPQLLHIKRTGRSNMLGSNYPSVYVEEVTPGKRVPSLQWLDQEFMYDSAPLPPRYMYVPPGYNLGEVLRQLAQAGRWQGFYPAPSMYAGLRGRAFMPEKFFGIEEPKGVVDQAPLGPEAGALIGEAVSPFVVLSDSKAYIAQPDIKSTVEALVDPLGVVNLNDYLPQLAEMLRQATGSAGLKHGTAHLVPTTPTSSAELLQTSLRIYIVGTNPLIVGQLKKNLSGKEAFGITLVDNLADSNLVIADVNFNPVAREEYLSSNQGAFLEVNRVDVAKRLNGTFLKDLEKNGFLARGTYLLLDSIVADQAILTFA